MWRRHQHMWSAVDITGASAAVLSSLSAAVRKLVMETSVDEAADIKLRSKL
jgi:hypothetical protein